MDKKTLRKVQLVQLEIAKEIDRVCKENDIGYILESGTLLGAIRHNGFIPWDDDLDIGMLRSDYEKFIQIAPRCLGEKYKLVDWKSDRAYPHPMAKVIKRGTIYKESKRNDLGEQGIWVDIFPHDNLGNSKNKMRRKFFELKVLRGLVRAKCDYQTWHTGNGVNIMKYVKNFPFRIAKVFFKKETIINIYERISRSTERVECEYVYENGTENYKEWCFPKECFIKTEEKIFEGYLFRVPQMYDEYLKIAYGDYMKLPPKEQRENKHMIEEVDFGD